MAIVNLYNGIYKTLSNDETILYYLGLKKDSSALDKAKKIQKRSKPTDIVDNLPLIAFYTLPGRREVKNLSVYQTSFVFDVYTADDVDLSHRITQRLIELFEGQLVPFENNTTFESMFLTAGEGETDLDNTYCFSTVFGFSIEINKR